MEEHKGFTLIELVIVIIILGILAAVAVPKFVDLQTDARKSMMKGVKGALEGAATTIHAKAVVEGKEKTTGSDLINGVPIVYGYPADTTIALTLAANLDSNDWLVFGGTGAGTGSGAIITAVGYSAASGACQVEYKLQASPARPTITVEDGGC